MRGKETNTWKKPTWTNTLSLSKNFHIKETKQAIFIQGLWKASFKKIIPVTKMYYYNVQIFLLCDLQFWKSVKGKSDLFLRTECQNSCCQILYQQIQKVLLWEISSHFILIFHLHKGIIFPFELLICATKMKTWQNFIFLTTIT